MRTKNLLDHMKAKASFEMGEVVADMIRGYFEDSYHPTSDSDERWDTAKGKAICVEQYSIPFVQVLMDIEKCKTMGELFDYLTGEMDGVLGTMWEDENTLNTFSEWKGEYEEIHYGKDLSY